MLRRNRIMFSEVNTNKIYAQATKNTKRGNENVFENQQYSTLESSFQMIIKKLSDQKKTFKRVEEMLTALEYGNKGVIRKAKMASGLKIMCWNPNGLVQRQQELQVTLDRNNIDV